MLVFLVSTLPTSAKRQARDDPNRCTLIALCGCMPGCCAAPRPCSVWHERSHFVGAAAAAPLVLLRSSLHPASVHQERGDHEREHQHPQRRSNPDEQSDVRALQLGRNVLGGLVLQREQVVRRSLACLLVAHHHVDQIHIVPVFRQPFELECDGACRAVLEEKRIGSSPPLAVGAGRIQRRRHRGPASVSVGRTDLDFAVAGDAVGGVEEAAGRPQRIPLRVLHVRAQRPQRVFDHGPDLVQVDGDLGAVGEELLGALGVPQRAHAAGSRRALP
mmetsp:Transcript_47257/g.111443  ORF Transcript_47257/g.111443 Transcript_47257/m.111443 type:complete len:274 (+) Transcript_47257:241-1062(+)